MSRITTYRNITSLSIHDLLLISDMGTIGNPTKTVTVGDLIDFGVGSGTPLYLPMWTSDGNLTDSNFFQTSTGNIRTDDNTLLGFGKDGGRKSSVDLGITLGCDFFFSCEINSTNFKSPNSTNILG